MKERKPLEWEWTKRHYGICVFILRMHELVAFQSDEEPPDVQLSLLTGVQRSSGWCEGEEGALPFTLSLCCSPAVFLLVRR